jgi:hypothetical protein
MHACIHNVRALPRVPRVPAAIPATFSACMQASSIPDFDTSTPCSTKLFEIICGISVALKILRTRGVISNNTEFLLDVSGVISRVGNCECRKSSIGIISGNINYSRFAEKPSLLEEKKTDPG